MYAKMVFAMMEADLDALKQFENMPKRRVLADENLEFAEIEDTDTTQSGLAPGLDNQLDDSEINDIEEIPQSEPTEQLDAVNSIQDADQGTVGDDSTVDDSMASDSSDSGTSFMTYVMYIGGALLVLALIAGACYMVQQQKDAN